MGKKGGLGTVLGGAAGFMVGGPAGAAIGAGIGGSIGGAGDAADASKRMGRAAQNAAMAQQQAAREAFARTEAPTVAALSQFDTAIKSQERNLARQEQLISQIDPTILEASQQALKLLRGEESSALAPAKAQRDMQRQKLLSSLREQLGPGAETSTAGIQALTRFDAETNSLMAGAQQQALSNMGQTFGTFSSYKPNMGQEATTFGNLAQGRVGVAFDRERAAGQGLQQTAGAQYTGQMVRAQGQMAQAGQMQQIGGQLIGAGLGGMMGGGGGGFTPFPNDRSIM